MKYILTIVMLCLATRFSAQTVNDSVSIMETVPADSIFTISHIMPEFPGGQAALMQYVSKNLKVNNINWDDYEDYYEAFVCRFVVTKTGNIENIEVIRSTQIPKLDSIYCDLFNNMPPWKPGTHYGKNVDVYYTIPLRVRFRR